MKKYDALIDVAKEALILGCALPAAETAILADIAVLSALNEQMRVVENKINALSSNVREIKLVSSIPGFGILFAAAFVSEIRDFCNFKSPKKFAAFCGIDPAVLQSGKFKGSQVKISKRGSVFLRRVLYTAALASIRKKRNGDYFRLITPEEHLKAFEEAG